MSEEITREIFDHIVQLAALELSEDEAEYLRGELNKQLRAVHELQAIPLDPSVQATSHGVPYTPDTTPAIRSDEWHPHPDSDLILEQAPETDERFFVVPEIPHEELE